MGDYASAIPVLASLNIAESAKFYTGVLGFNVGYQDDNYLIVQRDRMEIHFWLTDDCRYPENTSCYIRGGQVVELYAEYSDRNFGQGRLSDFSVRPWNMKEFYVHDVHGNLVKFGCAPEEVA
ncbi:MAG: hypothetical protein ACPG51_21085 [Thiolinea sp.]